MAITRNGNATSQGFSGGTSAVQTHAVGGALQSNCVLVCVLSFNTTTTTPSAVTSITDSQGNTWQKYTGQSANAGWHTADLVGGVQKNFAVEVWYCIGATVNTSINITANFSATIDSLVMATSAKYLGVNAAHPFDLNGVLPKSLTLNAGTTALTLTGVSTTTTNILPMVAYGSFGTNIASQNWTYNSVAQDDNTALQHNNGEFVKGQISEGSPTTGPYSGVTFSAPTSADNGFIIGFALTADTQTVGNPVLSQIQIVG